MIVTFKPYGRLGNRLFLFARLIAFSDRYSIDISNYAFRQYSDFFLYWRNNVGCYYGNGPRGRQTFLWSGAVIKLKGMMGVVPIVRFWDEREIIFDGEDSDDPRIRQMVELPLCIFEGWNFRCHEQMLLSLGKIRTMFAPREDIHAKVCSRIVEARARGDKILGVHIRWEDYRGTERFFSMREFSDSISSVRSSLGRQKVVCVICSPEKLDSSELPENCITFEENDPVADMYTLGGCDYILGPPSTFSQWASFYGGKPLIVMNEHGRKTELESASVVRW